MALISAAVLAAWLRGPEPSGPPSAGPAEPAAQTPRAVDPPPSTADGPRGRARARAAPRRPRARALTATPIEWRSSVAVGRPEAGRLIRGVKLPREGRHFFTWDPVRKRSPNRFWRRYGTDRLVRVLLRVARRHGAAHPAAPRVSIGDLSRPRGGDFGVRYGIVGHASHQNGLDADVYYPRRDERERAPSGVCASRRISSTGSWRPVPSASSWAPRPGCGGRPAWCTRSRTMTIICTSGCGRGGDERLVRV